MPPQQWQEEDAVPTGIRSRNSTASFVVDDQSTHVFGGMTNPNGDGVTYIILTATVVDSLGRSWADARADYAGESVE